MRVFIAGLLGGIVFFAWAALAHMFLPIGEMGHGAPVDEAAVLGAMRQGLPQEEGIYLLPYLAPDRMQDEAAVKDYSTRALANANAFIVYQPQGRDGMDMGRNLAVQFVSDTASAMIVAFVLALGAFAFSRRVVIAGALGLFSWLAVNVPYWNWYRFPLEFTLGALIEQVLGWLLAGAVMAWWLGRTQR